MTKIGADTASDWHALSALFDQAQDMTAEGLQAWLAELQAQAHPLLPSLQRMLAAREQLHTDDFMARSPQSALASLNLPPDWAEGARVGIYRLLRPLGSGGMAEVWLATREDGHFTRQVAVKLLYQQASSTQRRSLTERFMRERHILAALNHPHIASLLDAGLTPQGQPWLALEYVQGQPITLWCDNQRLDLRARVRLFCQVLQAVQHAHSNLVLHRDLKPANILVNEQGQAQLLDFGIAKLLERDGASADETELTRLGGRALTPQYASPEQVRGEPLSTASDVYSLGVVLYETLCGLLPYEIRQYTPAQVESAILDAEPRAPSRRTVLQEAARSRAVATSVALRKALDGELDAIVLKALAKEPQQRYGTVEALRQDLERWLDGEPVLAKAPSATYRLRKFVARHAVAVGLGSAAVVFIVGLAVAAVVLGLQARTESERAVAARDFLIGMFKQADPDRHQGRQVSATELLDAGQQRLHKTMAAQPLLQADLQRGLGEAQASMSEYKKADISFESAANTYLRAGDALHAAEADVERAMVIYRLGQAEQALRLLDAAQPRLGAEAGHPARWGRYYEVRTFVQLELGDLGAAADASARSLELNRRAYGPVHAKTVASLAAVADVQTREGKFTAAAQHLEQALEMAAQVPDVEPQDVLAMQFERAMLDFNAGQMRSALVRLEHSAAQCEQTLDPKGETCFVLRNLQLVILVILGERQQALEVLPRILHMADNRESPRRAADAQILAYRVWSLTGEIDRHPESTRWVERLGDAGAADGANRVSSTAALLAQAETHLRSGRPAQAFALLDRVDARLGADPAASRRTRARADLMRGLALQASGATDEGLAKLRAGAVVYAELLGAKHPLTLIMAANMARAMVGTGQAAQATAMLDDALPILALALGSKAQIYVRMLSLRDEIAAGKVSKGDRKIEVFL